MKQNIQTNTNVMKVLLTGIMNRQKRISRVKNIMKITLIICVLFSCSGNNQKSDKERLIKNYASVEDSLKRKAVTFLFDNMAEHTSDIPANIWYGTVPDNEILDNKFLADDIDLAFRLWNKYPWADSVPLEIFMNYLLPYKVYGEEPSGWRHFFHHKYKDTLASFIKTYSAEDIKISNNLYYVILVDEVGSWFKYSSTPFFKARHPGFNELMETKSADCYGWSYLNVNDTSIIRHTVCNRFCAVMGQKKREPLHGGILG
jgi:hypothetical protein